MKSQPITDADELPRDLLTIKQAARLANNAHQNTIRRWILKGRIPAWRIGDGRTFYVRRADIVKMIHQVPIDPNPIKGIGPTQKQIDARNARVMEELRRRGCA